mmetsp:Transcript_133537/g.386538  ORF Transcript_133537/g.386538 Transcript_133537/m.386538 type:complete len:307 (-) Transcript_133537:1673-2593(-)
MKGLHHDDEHRQQTKTGGYAAVRACDEDAVLVHFEAGDQHDENVKRAQSEEADLNCSRRAPKHGLQHIPILQPAAEVLRRKEAMAVHVHGQAEPAADVQLTAHDGRDHATGEQKGPNRHDPQGQLAALLAARKQQCANAQGYCAHPEDEHEARLSRGVDAPKWQEAATRGIVLQGPAVRSDEILDAPDHEASAGDKCTEREKCHRHIREVQSAHRRDGRVAQGRHGQQHEDRYAVGVCGTAHAEGDDAVDGEEEAQGPRQRAGHRRGLRHRVQLRSAAVAAFAAQLESHQLRLRLHAQLLHADGCA